MLETLFNICAIIAGIIFLVMRVSSPVGAKLLELVIRLIGALLIIGAIYHLVGVPFQIHK